MSSRFHRLRAALPFVLLPLAFAIAMHLLDVDDAKATADGGKAGGRSATAQAATTPALAADLKDPAAPSPLQTGTR